MMLISHGGAYFVIQSYITWLWENFSLQTLLYRLRLLTLSQIIHRILTLSSIIIFLIVFSTVIGNIISKLRKRFFLRNFLCRPNLLLSLDLTWIFGINNLKMI